MKNIISRFMIFAVLIIGFSMPALAQSIGLQAQSEFVCKVKAGDARQSVTDTVFLTLYWQPASHIGHFSPTRKMLVIRTANSDGARDPEGRSDTPLEALLRNHSTGDASGATYGSNFDIGLALDIRLGQVLDSNVAPRQPYELSDFDGFNGIGGSESELGKISTSKIDGVSTISFSSIINGRVDFKMQGPCRRDGD